MKLLILTQKIDKADDVLGFFHNWVTGLAGRFEQVIVICLELGSYDFPSNVRVLSLGKESGNKRLGYVYKLFKYLINLRSQYDSVFVHMNEEYVLLAGWWWRLTGKRLALWRNHPLGSWKTRLAVLLANKVFYTSPQAFTARFIKAEKMPVGIDTNKFTIQDFTGSKKDFVTIGRISPIKKILLMIEAINILRQQGINTSFDIVGRAVSLEDKRYENQLNDYIKQNNLETQINFVLSVANEKVPEVLNSYKFFINLTPDGSFDKAIFEAMACGLPIVTSNQALAEVTPRDFLVTPLPDSVSVGLERALAMSEQDRQLLGKNLRDWVIQNHGLNVLLDKLTVKFSYD